MNDEIKEILRKIQNVVNHKEASYNGLIETKAEDYKMLLDYITNLQQDLDKANEIIIKDRQFNQGRLLDLAKLKEENERLKEENFDIRQNIYIEKSGIPQQLTQDKTFMDLYDMPTYEDYKSRCEKGIEYIRKYDGEPVLREYYDRDLLNILQNGSDSQ